MKVQYCNYDAIVKLGLPLFSGHKVYDYLIDLNDNNYVEILNTADQLCSNLDPNGAYFQSREISNIIYNHMRSDPVKTAVTSANPFKDRYNNNNDVFIHMRLTDAAQFSPGVKYYLDALKSIDNFDNIYLATDEFTHPFVKQLITAYPNIIKITEDVLRTIQFGGTCKHIILSHGSYSAVIGYLAYFSNVHYPEYEQRTRGPRADVGTVWCGDMFSVAGWTKHMDHISTRGYAYQDLPTSLLAQ